MSASVSVSSRSTKSTRQSFIPSVQETKDGHPRVPMKARRDSVAAANRRRNTKSALKSPPATIPSSISVDNIESRRPQNSPSPSYIKVANIDLPITRVIESRSSARKRVTPSNIEDFVEAFKPFAEKSTKGAELRRNTFADLVRVAPNSSKYCDISGLISFLRTTLRKHHGPSTGNSLFRLYKTCTQHALSNAKLITELDNIMTSSGSSGEDLSNSISLVEFRLFNLYTCVYASMLETFYTIISNYGSSGSDGTDSEGVKVMSKATWTNFIKDQLQQQGSKSTVQYPKFIVGFEGISMIQSEEMALSIFDKLQDGSARISFAEFATYLRDAEINKETSIGFLLMGNLGKKASSGVASSFQNTALLKTKLQYSMQERSRNTAVAPVGTTATESTISVKSSSSSSISLLVSQSDGEEETNQQDQNEISLSRHAPPKNESISNSDTKETPYQKKKDNPDSQTTKSCDEIVALISQEDTPPQSNDLLDPFTKLNSPFSTDTSDELKNQPKTLSYAKSVDGKHEYSELSSTEKSSAKITSLDSSEGAPALLDPFTKSTSPSFADDTFGEAQSMDKAANKDVPEVTESYKMEIENIVKDSPPESALLDLFTKSTSPSFADDTFGEAQLMDKAANNDVPKIAESPTTEMENTVETSDPAKDAAPESDALLDLFTKSASPSFADDTFGEAQLMDKAANMDAPEVAESHKMDIENTVKASDPAKDAAPESDALLDLFTKSASPSFLDDTFGEVQLIDKAANMDAPEVAEPYKMEKENTLQALDPVRDSPPESALLDLFTKSISPPLRADASGEAQLMDKASTMDVLELLELTESPMKTLDPAKDTLPESDAFLDSFIESASLPFIDPYKDASDGAQVMDEVTNAEVPEISESPTMKITNRDPAKDLRYYDSINAQEIDETTNRKSRGDISIGPDDNLRQLLERHQQIMRQWTPHIEKNLTSVYSIKRENKREELKDDNKESNLSEVFSEEDSSRALKDIEFIPDDDDDLEKVSVITSITKDYCDTSVGTYSKPTDTLKVNSQSEPLAIDIHPYAIGSFIEIIYDGQNRNKRGYSQQTEIEILLARVIDRTPLKWPFIWERGSSPKRWKYQLYYCDLDVKEWVHDLSSKVVSPPSVGNVKALKFLPDIAAESRDDETNETKSSEYRSGEVQLKGREAVEARSETSEYQSQEDKSRTSAGSVNKSEYKSVWSTLAPLARILGSDTNYRDPNNL